MQTFGCGRDCIFLPGGKEASATEAAFAKLPYPTIKGGLRCSSPVCDLQLVWTPDSAAALVFTAATQLVQEQLQYRLSLVKPETKLELAVSYVLHSKEFEPTADHLSDIEKARAYSLGGNDLSVARGIAQIRDERLRRAVLVFMGGMIGQDVADRLGQVLGLYNVTQKDIRDQTAVTLTRYRNRPTALASVMCLAADWLTPIENTAVYLALGL